MKLGFTAKEKIAGTFMILVGLLLLTTVIIIGRGKDWFKTYVTYFTTFDESYNLQEDAAVKLFKANIGKVKQITPVGDKVRVKLIILEDFASRIRGDSVATVESPTFIGSEYISIKPGSTHASLIQEGGEIPSKAKKKLSDIMDEFQVEKTAKMVVKAVQDLSEVAQILRDPKGPVFTALDHINNSLSHIEMIVRDIQVGKGTVGSMLKSRELLEAILVNLDTVKKILGHIETASIKTPEAMGQVQDNLAQLRKIQDEVSESIAGIQKILRQLDESAGMVKSILSNVKEGSVDVPEVIRSTKEGIQEIRDGVENVDKVVQSLQKNILIRPNLPPEPKGKNTDAGLRP